MNHERKIQVHLAHAKRKHPHFADALIYGCLDRKLDLSIERDDLESDIKEKCVHAESVLNCELAEVYEAIAAGRAEDAVEEIYDAVSVLLRMAEWVNERGCK